MDEMLVAFPTDPNAQFMVESALLRLPDQLVEPFSFVVSASNK